MSDENLRARAALAASGFTAILASACCLGPLLLVSLGLSGAWIGSLSALEPYRPWLIVLALIALAFAWRSIFRPADLCEGDAICATPRARRAYQLVFWIVAVLVITAVGFPYLLPLFY